MMCHLRLHCMLTLLKINTSYSLHTSYSVLTLQIVQKFISHTAYTLNYQTVLQGNQIA